MQQHAMYEILDKCPYDDAHQKFRQPTKMKRGMWTAPCGDSQREGQWRIDQYFRVVIEFAQLHDVFPSGE